MSLKSLAFVFFSLGVVAQSLPFPDGVSYPRSMRPEDSQGDRTLPDADERIGVDRYDPTNERSPQFNGYNIPPTAELSERGQAKPISGTVSLRQLQHPPSKKAVRLFPRLVLCSAGSISRGRGSRPKSALA